MSVLIITPRDKEEIEKAIVIARENVVPWTAMKSIADLDPTHELHMTEEKRKKADAVYKAHPTQSLTLGNCRVAFSFEQQPAGLFRHLSVSVHRAKLVPGYEVVKMLALEFGFSDFPPKRAYRVWTEEYEPRYFAVNVIELEVPRDGS